MFHFNQKSSPSLTAGFHIYMWILSACYRSLEATVTYSQSLTEQKDGQKQYSYHRVPPPTAQPSSQVGSRGSACPPSSPAIGVRSLPQHCGPPSASCWTSSTAQPPPIIRSQTVWLRDSTAVWKTLYGQGWPTPTGWHIFHGLCLVWDQPGDKIPVFCRWRQFYMVHNQSCLGSSRRRRS
jgi:hypothetical protein